MIASCPTYEKLKWLSLGQLPEQQSDVLLRHLESCDACQEEISQIDGGDDAFVRQIQLAGALEPDEFESEHGCRIAVARALAALANHQSDSSQHGLPNVPDSIGEYDIVKPLGQGGMGHVYLGQHTKLSRPVAIKFIADHRRWDQTMHERFATEMRLIGGLKHPNIVVAHDAREVDGLAVLVTEYIDGMTVSEILKRTGRLEKADATKIISEICKALSYIDSQSLVHRDIKPSNIMIDADGEVKLLDLGLARIQSTDDMIADFTATGQAMGTADYIAPEQVHDPRNVDIRSDIYGLGCTFYKLVSGQAPFAAKHQTAFAKMNAHVSETPDSLTNTALPSDLSKLVDKMLEKNPVNRPQTPNAVLEKTEKHSGRSNLAELIARARTMPERKANLSVAGASATTVKKTDSSFFRKHPWASVIAGGLAAFAFGIWLGVVVWIKNPDGSIAKVEIPDGSTAIVDDQGNIEILLAGSGQKLNIPRERVSGLPAQGMVLHYDFEDIKDGVVLDRSGFSHHGKVHGNIESVDGIKGKGVRIKKSADYIDALHETLDLTEWPGATFSAWLYIDGITTYGTVLSFADVGGKTSSMCMGIGPIGAQFRAGGLSARELTLVPQAFARKPNAPFGRWHHLVGTRDANNVRFYIDGVLDCEKSSIEDLPFTGSPNHTFTIGKYRAHRENWLDSYPKGIVDEVQIWKSALTPDQVKSLYLDNQKTDGN